MRPTQPNDKRVDFGSALSSASESVTSSSKRRCVSSACIPCRRRKSKCDGEQPTCSTCTAVYKTSCSYGPDSEQRRKCASKKEKATFTGERDSLIAIFKAIQSCPESGVAAIVRQIRNNDSPDVVAENLPNDTTLPEIANISLTGERSDQFIGRAAFEGGTIRAYGLSSGLGLASEQEMGLMQLHHKEDWTTVTRDQNIVELLLKLYFSWVHPFYCFFSEKMFREDFFNNRTGHCSSLLVNAILAVAWPYYASDRARSNPVDHSTSGDHFFAAAEHILINQRNAANLTTVQALALMGLREVSVGRPNSGFQYFGRCMRMVVELGLHICIGPENFELDPRDLEARKITFWACYNHDATWSICIGRIAQLPRDAITVKKPTLEEYHNEQGWVPWRDTGAMTMTKAPQVTSTLNLLHQYSALSDIVNDAIFMSYAPREPFTSVKVLELHGRYQRWFTNLPDEFQVQPRGAVTTPHVLMLHMYYHAVVLNLFRPLCKFSIINSEVSPRRICEEMADSAAALVTTYRNLYGLRHVPILLTHVIFTSTIIHLLRFTDNPTVPHVRSINDAPDLRLAESISSLRETTSNHNFSTRLLRVLVVLVERWNIKLPSMVENALAPSPTNNPMALPAGNLQYSLQPPGPSQNNTYHESVFPGGPPMPQLASPPFDDPWGSFYWSPFYDGSVPLPSYAAVSQIDHSTGFSQPEDQWRHLDQYGYQVAAYDHRIPQGFSVDGHWPSE